MPPPDLSSTLLLLGLCAAAVAIAHAVRLPAVIAYLLVGLLAGPHVLGWLAANDTMRLLGEIGIAFLLFTIGLEFSLTHLRSMYRTLLGMGGAQVFIGTLTGAAIAWWLGVPWQAALIVGGALSLSSTAIVVKALSDQLELKTRHGRLAVGILLFQDLAAVPFLVAIPLLAMHSGTATLAALGIALAKAAVAVVMVLGAGRWLSQPFFKGMARASSPELVTLAALFTALAAAWLTGWLGLSFALGAFLAGMMLGETEFRYVIQQDIRPFRDLLLGLFFVVVGMQLDPAAALAGWPWILLLVFGLMVGKGLVIALLARGAAYDVRTAICTGLALGQGGEFGIALITIARREELLTVGGDLILDAMIVSMALAPLLIRYAPRIAAALPAAADREAAVAEVAAGEPGLDRHVIVCGYGRTGATIASVLRQAGVGWVALDGDVAQVRKAWALHEPVYFGDAARPDLLQAVGLPRAAALVVTFNDETKSANIIRSARLARPDIPIFTRAADDESLDRLVQAGALDGVPETLESGLMLGFQLLLLLELPIGAARRHIVSVRGDRYATLRGYFRSLESSLDAQSRHLRGQLRTVALPAGAHAIGRTIVDLRLDELDVLIATVQRAGGQPELPQPQLVFRADDRLVLHGDAGQLELAAARLLRGLYD